MSKPAFIVRDVSKSFRLPHERYSGLKQAIVNFRPGRRFERQLALDNINFEIQQGEFYAIVGRNGSGKSTLLKILAQIYTPDTGSVTVNGSLTPFIELGVGFNPELTGRENVYLNGALLGFDRHQMSEMYEDIVAFAEIERFMDQKLKNYSSGMQVRLAFSIAIRARSDILLLDEVLAVGDTGFQQKCFNYFEELKQEGKTVVFVSHDMAAVTRFCSRALYINDSKVVMEGTPSEVADAYLADNLERSLDSETNLPTTHTVSGKITRQSETGVDLKVQFTSKDDDEVYIGIAIIRDGISIAEITTPTTMVLRHRGELTYTLDTTRLNFGVYQIGVALFRKRNRELVGAGRRKANFILKGVDRTRGAALHLTDTWKAAK